MAYSRFGWDNSDVYVFMSSESLCCCGCILGDQWDYYSTQTMVDHLEEHIKQGHSVPSNLIPELWFDDKENFPYSENDPE